MILCVVWDDLFQIVIKIRCFIRNVTGCLLLYVITCLVSNPTAYKLHKYITINKPGYLSALVLMKRCIINMDI
jgi:hypothetical protein